MALDREAGRLPKEIAVWDEMTAKSTGADKGADATDAVRLVQDVDAAAAGQGRPRDGEPRGPAGEEARRAARPVRTRRRAVRQGGDDALALGAEAQKLRARLVATATAIAEAALVDLDKRLRHILRRRGSRTSTRSSARRRSWRSRSRNLREGRYPAEMFAHPTARGPDGRRRGVLAIRGRALVG